MKKLSLLSLLMLSLLMLYSCGQKKVEYSLKILTEEHVLDNEYNRDVKILKFETNSKHKDEINKAISTDFVAKLDDYMDGVPIEWQHLMIDTTWTEKGGVLCITAMANVPNATYVTPLYSESIYLDLETDMLYSFDEYAEKMGIDISDAEKTFGKLHSTGTFEITDLFYGDNETYLVFQIDTPDSMGISTFSTEIYACREKKLIHDSTFELCGFDFTK